MRAITKIGLAAATLFLAACFLLLRDGERITPDGDGVVQLDVGEFEAFAMPEYADTVIDDTYKSYFIEVEPGIKIHVLEVGQG